MSEDRRKLTSLKKRWETFCPPYECVVEESFAYPNKFYWYVYDTANGKWVAQEYVDTLEEGKQKCIAVLHELYRTNGEPSKEFLKEIKSELEKRGVEGEWYGKYPPYECEVVRSVTYPGKSRWYVYDTPNKERVAFGFVNTLEEGKQKCIAVLHELYRTNGEPSKEFLKEIESGLEKSGVEDYWSIEYPPYWCEVWDSTAYSGKFGWRVMDTPNEKWRYRYVAYGFANTLEEGKQKCIAVLHELYRTNGEPSEDFLKKIQSGLEKRGVEEEWFRKYPPYECEVGWTVGDFGKFFWGVYDTANKKWVAFGFVNTLEEGKQKCIAVLHELYRTNGEPSKEFLKEIKSELEKRNWKKIWENYISPYRCEIWKWGEGNYNWKVTYITQVHEDPAIEGYTKTFEQAKSKIMEVLHEFYRTNGKLSEEFLKKIQSPKLIDVIKEINRTEGKLRKEFLKEIKSGLEKRSGRERWYREYPPYACVVAESDIYPDKFTWGVWNTVNVSIVASGYADTLEEGKQKCIDVLHELYRTNGNPSEEFLKRVRSLTLYPLLAWQTIIYPYECWVGEWENGEFRWNVWNEAKKIQVASGHVKTLEEGKQKCIAVLHELYRTNGNPSEDFLKEIESGLEKRGVEGGWSGKYPPYWCEVGVLESTAYPDKFFWGVWDTPNEEWVASGIVDTLEEGKKKCIAVLHELYRTDGNISNEFLKKIKSGLEKRGVGGSWRIEYPPYECEVWKSGNPGKFGWYVYDTPNIRRIASGFVDTFEEGKQKCIAVLHELYRTKGKPSREFLKKIKSGLLESNTEDYWLRQYPPYVCRVWRSTVYPGKFLWTVSDTANDMTVVLGYVNTFEEGKQKCIDVLHELYRTKGKLSKDFLKKIKSGLEKRGGVDSWYIEYPPYVCGVWGSFGYLGKFYWRVWDALNEEWVAYGYVDTVEEGKQKCIAVLHELYRTKGKPSRDFLKKIESGLEKRGVENYWFREYPPYKCEVEESTAYPGKFFWWVWDTPNDEWVVYGYTDTLEEGKQKCIAVLHELYRTNGKPSDEFLKEIKSGLEKRGVIEEWYGKYLPYLCEVWKSTSYPGKFYWGVWRTVNNKWIAEGYEDTFEEGKQKCIAVLHELYRTNGNPSDEFLKKIQSGLENKGVEDSWHKGVEDSWNRKYLPYECWVLKSIKYLGKFYWHIRDTANEKWVAGGYVDTLEEGKQKCIAVLHELYRTNGNLSEDFLKEIRSGLENKGVEDSWHRKYPPYECWVLKSIKYPGKFYWHIRDTANQKWVVEGYVDTLEEGKQKCIAVLHELYRTNGKLSKDFLKKIQSGLEKRGWIRQYPPYKCLVEESITYPGKFQWGVHDTVNEKWVAKGYADTLEGGKKKCIAILHELYRTKGKLSDEFLKEIESGLEKRGVEDSWHGEYSPYECWVLKSIKYTDKFFWDVYDTGNEERVVYGYAPSLEEGKQKCIAVLHELYRTNGNLSEDFLKEIRSGLEKRGGKEWSGKCPPYSCEVWESVYPDEFSWGVYDIDNKKWVAYGYADTLEEGKQKCIAVLHELYRTKGKLSEDFLKKIRSGLEKRGGVDSWYYIEYPPYECVVRESITYPDKFYWGVLDTPNEERVADGYVDTFEEGKQKCIDVLHELYRTKGKPSKDFLKKIESGLLESNAEDSWRIEYPPYKCRVWNPTNLPGFFWRVWDTPNEEWVASGIADTFEEGKQKCIAVLHELYRTKGKPSKDFLKEIQSGLEKRGVEEEWSEKYPPYECEVWESVDYPGKSRWYVYDTANQKWVAVGYADTLEEGKQKCIAVLHELYRTNGKPSEDFLKKIQSGLEKRGVEEEWSREYSPYECEVRESAKYEPGQFYWEVWDIPNDEWVAYGYVDTFEEGKQKCIDVLHELYRTNGEPSKDFLKKIQSGLEKRGVEDSWRIEYPPYECGVWIHSGKFYWEVWDTSNGKWVAVGYADTLEEGKQKCIAVLHELYRTNGNPSKDFLKKIQSGLEKRGVEDSWRIEYPPYECEVEESFAYPNKFYWEVWDTANNKWVVEGYVDTVEEGKQKCIDVLHELYRTKGKLSKEFLKEIKSGLEKRGGKEWFGKYPPYECEVRESIYPGQFYWEVWDTSNGKWVAYGYVNTFEEGKQKCIAVLHELYRTKGKPSREFLKKIQSGLEKRGGKDYWYRQYSPYWCEVRKSTSYPGKFFWRVYDTANEERVAYGFASSLEEGKQKCIAVLHELYRTNGNLSEDFLKEIRSGLLESNAEDYWYRQYSPYWCRVWKSAYPGEFFWRVYDTANEERVADGYVDTLEEGKQKCIAVLHELYRTKGKLSKDFLKKIESGLEKRGTSGWYRLYPPYVCRVWESAYPGKFSWGVWDTVNVSIVASGHTDTFEEGKQKCIAVLHELYRTKGKLSDEFLKEIESGLEKRGVIEEWYGKYPPYECEVWIQSGKSYWGVYDTANEERVAEGYVDTFEEGKQKCIDVLHELYRTKGKPSREFLKEIKIFEPIGNVLKRLSGLEKRGVEDYWFRQYSPYECKVWESSLHLGKFVWRVRNTANNKWVADGYANTLEEGKQKCIDVLHELYRTNGNLSEDFLKEIRSGLEKRGWIRQYLPYECEVEESFSYPRQFFWSVWDTANNKWVVEGYVDTFEEGKQKCIAVLHELYRTNGNPSDEFLKKIQSGLLESNTEDYWLRQYPPYECGVWKSEFPGEFLWTVYDTANDMTVVLGYANTVEEGKQKCIAVLHELYRTNGNPSKDFLKKIESGLEKRGVEEEWFRRYSPYSCKVRKSVYLPGFYWVVSSNQMFVASGHNVDTLEEGKQKCIAVLHELYRTNGNLSEDFLKEIRSGLEKRGVIEEWYGKYPPYECVVWESGYPDEFYWYVYDTDNYKDVASGIASSLEEGKQKCIAVLHELYRTDGNISNEFLRKIESGLEKRGMWRRTYYPYECDVWKAEGDNPILFFRWGVWSIVNGRWVVYGFASSLEEGKQKCIAVLHELYRTNGNLSEDFLKEIQSGLEKRGVEDFWLMEYPPYECGVVKSTMYPGKFQWGVYDTVNEKWVADGYVDTLEEGKKKYIAVLHELYRTKGKPSKDFLKKIESGLEKRGGKDSWYIEYPPYWCEVEESAYTDKFFWGVLDTPNGKWVASGHNVDTLEEGKQKCIAVLHELYRTNGNLSDEFLKEIRSGLEKRGVEEGWSRQYPPYECEVEGSTRYPGKFYWEVWNTFNNRRIAFGYVPFLKEGKQKCIAVLHELYRTNGEPSEDFLKKIQSGLEKRGMWRRTYHPYECEVWKAEEKYWWGVWSIVNGRWVVYGFASSLEEGKQKCIAVLHELYRTNGNLSEDFLKKIQSGLEKRGVEDSWRRIYHPYECEVEESVEYPDKFFWGVWDTANNKWVAYGYVDTLEEGKQKCIAVLHELYRTDGNLSGEFLKKIKIFEPIGNVLKRLRGLEKRGVGNYWSREYPPYECEVWKSSYHSKFYWRVWDTANDEWVADGYVDTFEEGKQKCIAVLHELYRTKGKLSKDFLKKIQSGLEKRCVEYSWFREYSPYSCAVLESTMYPGKFYWSVWSNNKWVAEGYVDTLEEGKQKCIAVLHELYRTDGNLSGEFLKKIRSGLEKRGGKEWSGKCPPYECEVLESIMYPGKFGWYVYDTPNIRRIASGFVDTVEEGKQKCIAVLHELYRTKGKPSREFLKEIESGLEKRGGKEWVGEYSPYECAVLESTMYPGKFYWGVWDIPNKKRVASGYADTFEEGKQKCIDVLHELYRTKGKLSDEFLKKIRSGLEKRRGWYKQYSPYSCEAWMHFGKSYWGVWDMPNKKWVVYGFASSPEEGKQKCIDVLHELYRTKGKPSKDFLKKIESGLEKRSGKEWVGEYSPYECVAWETEYPDKFFWGVWDIPNEEWIASGYADTFEEGKQKCIDVLHELYRTKGKLSDEFLRKIRSGLEKSGAVEWSREYSPYKCGVEESFEYPGKFFWGVWDIPNDAWVVYGFSDTFEEGKQKCIAVLHELYRTNGEPSREFLKKIRSGLEKRGWIRQYPPYECVAWETEYPDEFFWGVWDTPNEEWIASGFASFPEEGKQKCIAVLHELYRTNGKPSKEFLKKIESGLEKRGWIRQYPPYECGVWKSYMYPGKFSWGVLDALNEERVADGYVDTFEEGKQKCIAVLHELYRTNGKLSREFLRKIKSGLEKRGGKDFWYIEYPPYECEVEESMKYPGKFYWGVDDTVNVSIVASGHTDTFEEGKQKCIDVLHELYRTNGEPSKDFLKKIQSGLEKRGVEDSWNRKYPPYECWVSKSSYHSKFYWRVWDILNDEWVADGYVDTLEEGKQKCIAVLHELYRTKGKLSREFLRKIRSGLEKRGAVEWYGEYPPYECEVWESSYYSKFFWRVYDTANEERVAYGFASSLEEGKQKCIAVLHELYRTNGNLSREFLRKIRSGLEKRGAVEWSREYSPYKCRVWKSSYYSKFFWRVWDTANDEWVADGYVDTLEEGKQKCIAVLHELYRTKGKLSREFLRKIRSGLEKRGVEDSWRIEYPPYWCRVWESGYPDEFYWEVWDTSNGKWVASGIADTFEEGKQKCIAVLHELYRTNGKLSREFLRKIRSGLEKRGAVEWYGEYPPYECEVEWTVGEVEWTVGHFGKFVWRVWNTANKEWVAQGYADTFEEGKKKCIAILHELYRTNGKPSKDFLRKIESGLGERGWTIEYPPYWCGVEESAYTDKFFWGVLDTANGKWRYVASGEVDTFEEGKQKCIDVLHELYRTNGKPSREFLKKIQSGLEKRGGKEWVGEYSPYECAVWESYSKSYWRVYDTANEKWVASGYADTFEEGKQKCIDVLHELYRTKGKPSKDFLKEIESGLEKRGVEGEWFGKYLPYECWVLKSAYPGKFFWWVWDTANNKLVVEGYVDTLEEGKQKCIAVLHELYRTNGNPSGEFLKKIKSGKRGVEEEWSRDYPPYQCDVWEVYPGKFRWTVVELDTEKMYLERIVYGRGRVNTLEEGKQKCIDVLKKIYREHIEKNSKLSFVRDITTDKKIIGEVKNSELTKIRKGLPEWSLV